VVKPSEEAGVADRDKKQQRTWYIWAVFSEVSDSFPLNGTIKNKQQLCLELLKGE